VQNERHDLRWTGRVESYRDLADDSGAAQALRSQLEPYPVRGAGANSGCGVKAGPITLDRPQTGSEGVHGRWQCLERPALAASAVGTEQTVQPSPSAGRRRPRPGSLIQHHHTRSFQGAGHGQFHKQGSAHCVCERGGQGGESVGLDLGELPARSFVV
jgi:hypothetical protein